MERTTKEKLLALKVGAFALVGVFLLVYMSIRVGEVPFREQQNRITIRASFDTVGGLEEKAQVRMAGVVIGRVMRIYLKDSRAVVEASVDRAAQLRVDAMPKITTHSMVGGEYLEFVPVSNTAELAHNGTQYEGVMSPGFQELASSTTNLMGKLSLIADDIKAVSESVKNVIGSKEGEEQLRGMIQKLDEAVSNINLILTENRQEVDRTVAAFRELAETLNEMTPRIMARVEGIAERADDMVSANQDEIREVVRNLRAASDRLDNVLSNVQGITNDIKEGKGTIGKLVTDDTVHDELATTLRDFRETMGSAKEFINQITGLEAYLGYRGEYLTDESEFKNYLTIKLQPRENKYFLFELVNDPYGKETTYEQYKYTETETERGGLIELVRVHKYTEERRIEKKVLFSLQYARRFGPLTLRGGLIESEGGVAGDLDLFDDRLTFTFEAFDFGNDYYDPHLKFTTRFDIYKAFFINAGVDEILNEDRRSFYAGVGLLFREDDIKFLFGKIPTGGF